MPFPITGIASSFRVPGGYAEILFAQGPSTATGGARSVVFVMPKDETAGSWSANSLYEVRNEQQAIDGAGAGSPLHRAFRAALRVYKGCAYWAVPYLPSNGAGGVAADVDLTYATTPTASGTTHVWVCGELAASYAYTTSDSATTIAAGVVAQINAKTHLPVAASNAAGVLTLTAKIIGASQGDGTIGQYQVYATVRGGTGVTVNGGTQSYVEVGGTVSGVDGATTEASLLSTALTTLDAVREYYVGVSMSDATGVGHLVTHLTAKSLPNPGLRSVGLAAYTHTKAAAITLATAKNYERLQILAGVDLESDWSTIVGATAALRCRYESQDSAAGFDDFRDSAWVEVVKPARDPADWLDVTDLNDLINAGVTPIASDARGARIAMSVTTRSKDATGAVDDFRAAETHRISVADEYVDRVLARDRATYANTKLQSDELLPDGTVNTNADLPPRTTTPHFYKHNFMIPELREFAPGHFQEVASMIASMDVSRDPANTGRLQVAHDIRVIDLRHQVVYSLAEISPG